MVTSTGCRTGSPDHSSSTQNVSPLRHPRATQTNPRITRTRCNWPHWGVCQTAARLDKGEEAPSVPKRGKPSSPHPPTRLQTVHARASDHGQASDGMAGDAGFGLPRPHHWFQTRWPPGLMSRIIVAASPCSASDQRVWVLGDWTSARNLRLLHGPEAQNTLPVLCTQTEQYSVFCTSRLYYVHRWVVFAGVVASSALASTLLS